MELAFSALLIFLLVLPGILYRSAYQSGWERWKIPNPAPAVIDQVSRSLVAALIAHVLWYVLCEWIFLPLLSWLWPLVRGIHIALEVIPMLLLGEYGENSTKLQMVLDSFCRAPHPQLVLLYFVSLYLTTWLTGVTLHALVRRYHLDYKVPRLRFDNEWFYTLYPYPKNIVLEDATGGEWKFGATVVSAVVTLSKADYIYQGTVENYNFAPDGSLYSLQLTEVKRRPLDAANDATDNFYPIVGNFMVLCLSEIKTLAITYVMEPA